VPRIAGVGALKLSDEIGKRVRVRRHKPEESSECKSRTRQGLASHLGLE